MAKIIGNTMTTPMVVPDWEQTDVRKADYIKNKPDIAALQALVGDKAVAEQINEIVKNYIKDLVVTGSVITYLKGDGASESINTTFVGTRSEYETAYAAGKIPVGTFVMITDEGDLPSTSTSSKLGEGVLGYMVLA